MSFEIKVQALPESVADATLASWLKNEGDAVARDEVIALLETDKVTLDMVAPKAGVLRSIRQKEGAVVKEGEVLAVLEEGAAAGNDERGEPAAAESKDSAGGDQAANAGDGGQSPPVNPAARSLIEEHHLDTDDIKGSGAGGRVVVDDVRRHLALLARSLEEAGDGEEAQASASKAASEERTKVEAPAAAQPAAPTAQPAAAGGAASPHQPLSESSFLGSLERGERRVPMTRMRARIAERMLQAQNATASLTTFNEINMKPLMEMRMRMKEDFEHRHGVRLGVMSIFVKAAVTALRDFPEINASIDGEDIVYHSYFDIGVAVSTDRGLVVPVLRNAEYMGFADIERAIGDFAARANEGKLSLNEMTGGTFTLTNGGIFGSLLSTPMLNPPQSAILGMHAIKERPVVVAGEIVIRPMMYVALSYDHRLIDGRGAVGFLRLLKERVETPERLLFEL